MNSNGLRKAALYMSTIPQDAQRDLLAALPAESQRALKPLIAHVVAQGWNLDELIGRALAEEIRGLTAESSLSIDALLALPRALPADWVARVFASNAAMDTGFLLALLDAPMARRVREQLDQVPRLPARLREAIMVEAADSIRVAA